MTEANVNPIWRKITSHQALSYPHIFCIQCPVLHQKNQAYERQDNLIQPGALADNRHRHSKYISKAAT